MTHEEYIQAIRQLVLQHCTSQDEHDHIAACKLTYGLGTKRTRGTACLHSWSTNDQQIVGFAHVSAKAEESITQLIGTTIHELAHIACNIKGHGKKWKKACSLLGLTTCEAKGQSYKAEHFYQPLWNAIDQLEKPTDGSPSFGGTVGTTSKGSRLRLWECECQPAVKVRVASDNFIAECKLCNQYFRSV
jgi:hypothetical protein